MRQTSRWIVAAALGLTLSGCAATGSGTPSANGTPSSGTTQTTPSGTNTTLSTIPPSPRSTTPTEGGTPPRAAGVVTISRTGGLAGVNEMIQIAPDGTWVFRDRKSGDAQQGKLTTDQHNQLNRLIATSAFAAEARQKPTGVCNDGFTYTVAAGDLAVRYTQCGGTGNQPTVKAVISLVTGATPM